MRANSCSDEPNAKFINFTPRLLSVPHSEIKVKNEDAVFLLVRRVSNSLAKAGGIGTEMCLQAF
jgi:hypothetical protein